MLRITVWFVAMFIYTVQQLHSQQVLNLPEHDAKPLYWGLSIGANTDRFKLMLHPQFLQNDSISATGSSGIAGFNMGLLVTQRLSDHFQLRINPQLAFASRSILYTLKYPENKQPGISTRLSSILVSVPLQLKMQSDRMGNIRFYVLAGFQVNMDLNKGIRDKKDEDLLRIKKYDYGPELGLGVNLFFSTFILSPEIKIVNGLNDIHQRNEHVQYSAVFNKIQSRMVVFCLHIEG